MANYRYVPAHPDKVAGLSDAAALRSLSTYLDDAIDRLTTHPARQALMDSRAVINAAVRDLTPYVSCAGMVISRDVHCPLLVFRLRWALGCHATSPTAAHQ